MPDENFFIEGHNIGLIKIDPQKIKSGGVPPYPRLVIPFELSIKPREIFDQKKSQITHVQNYTLLQFWGKLSIVTTTEGAIEIANFQSEPFLHFSQDGDLSKEICIPLDHYKVKYLEDKRESDWRFRLNFMVLIIKHPLNPYAQKGKDKKVQELLTSSFALTLDIPQSYWIKNVLPGLGYGKIKLIEIPIPEKIIPNTFQKALKELEASQEYFVEGDYNKAVGHCRSAIQLIPETLTVDLSSIAKPSFNDRVKKFLSQHLSTVLTDSKRKYLETIINATWKLSSITHHPSNAVFFRSDAQAVMLVTTALLAYVGKMLKQVEQK